MRGVTRRAVLAALVVLAVTARIAVAGDGKMNDKTFEYSVGLRGDVPYSDLQATTASRT